MAGHYIRFSGTELSPAMRLISAPIYPAALAIGIVLAAVQDSLGAFAPDDAVRPAVLIGLTVVGATAILSRFLGNVDRAACICALIAAALLLDFGSRVSIGIGILLLVCCVALLRWNLVDAKATIVANVVSLALLASPAYAIATHIGDAQRSELKVDSVFDSLQKDKASGVLPNIVHIVLDGYSDAAVLREVYDYDNSSFLDGLRRLGFRVAGNARSPYNQTLFAMSSVFSGAYVTEAAPGLLQQDTDKLRLDLASGVVGGPVHKLMGRLGYRMLATEIGYGPLSRKTDATMVVGAGGWWSGLSMFEEFLFLNRRSGLALILDAVGVKERRSLELILNATEQRAYAKTPAPFFLYEHILAPHPPFNVDENGAPTERWEDHFSTISDGDHATRSDPKLQQQYREGYIAKLRFINSRILSQLQDLVDNAPSPKVIILHGDHGGGSTLRQNDSSQTCVRERMAPLFAVYSDNPALLDAFREVENGIYNIVNTYRIIFDRYHDVPIGSLPGRSHFVNWDAPSAVEVLPEERLSAPCQRDSDRGEPNRP